MKASLDKREDSELLRRFSETGNQAAFRALVERYTGMVYGVAFRRTGDAHLSEEITQNVFLILARRADGLSIHRSLGAWLHGVTMRECYRLIRKETNRQRYLGMIREQQEARSESEEANWGAIRPHLDQLLSRLSSRDRDILILHYIEGLKFSEVGRKMGMSPAAAQKRSTRALEKISAYLKRYGVVASTAFLTKGLQAELVSTAPAGLVGKIGGASLTTTSATMSAGTFGKILTTMTTSKLAFGMTFLVSAFTPTILMSLGSESKAEDSRRVDKEMVTPVRSVLSKRESKSFDREEFRQLLRELVEDKEEALVAERGRALQRLMFTLELDEAKDAIAELDEAWLSSEGLRSEYLSDVLAKIFQCAYSRWAEIDPVEAVASAFLRKDSELEDSSMKGAWETWAFTDWDAALVWKSEHYDSSSFWTFLDRQAEADGPLALERANDLAAVFPEMGDDYLKRALWVWGKNEPQNAIEWMDENLSEPVRRDEIISHFVEVLGEFDPAKALGQIDLITNIDRAREVRANILTRWALLQPMEAGSYFEQSGGGEVWKTSRISDIGEALSRNQPDYALEIARTIQDEERRNSFYFGILEGAKESELSPVLDAAIEIGLEEFSTKGSLPPFLIEWASYNEGAAKAWLSAHPAGPKKERILQIYSLELAKENEKR